MTEYYVLWRITLQSNWIAVVAALLVTYLLLRKRTTKQMAELVWDGFFYFVLIWKLSVLIFQFNLVRQSPISILYFNGGSAGAVAGFLGAILILWWKKTLPIEKPYLIASSLLLIQAFYQLFHALLGNYSSIALLVTVSIAGMVIYYLIQANKWSTLAQGQVLIGIGALHFFCAVWQPNGWTTAPLFITLLILGLYGITSQLTKRREICE